MDYSKAMILGRLTADPIAHAENGKTTRVNFSLAVNQKYGDKETVSYFDCVAFNSTAELIANTLSVKKGMQLFVEANMRQTSYEKDGRKLKSTSYVVREFRLMSAKNLETAVETVPA